MLPYALAQSSEVLQALLYRGLIHPNSRLEKDAGKSLSLGVISDKAKRYGMDEWPEYSIGNWKGPCASCQSLGWIGG